MKKRKHDSETKPSNQKGLFHTLASHGRSVQVQSAAFLQLLLLRGVSYPSQSYGGPKLDYQHIGRTLLSVPVRRCSMVRKGRESAV